MQSGFVAKLIRIYHTDSFRLYQLWILAKAVTYWFHKEIALLFPSLSPDLLRGAHTHLSYLDHLIGSEEKICSTFIGD